MPEYIEKGIVLATLSKFGTTRNMRASKAIAAIHPADVAPVVHAQWIEKDCITGKYFECSNCHKPENKHTAIKGKYCWYCGAKMDGTEVMDEVQK